MGKQKLAAEEVPDKQARKMTRNQTIKQANRELSCVAPNKISARVSVGDPQDDQTTDVQAGHELAEHLRSIAPFNRRWQVTKTINEGTYGVVFAVKDVKTGTEGVIKVAKSMASGNQTTEWEGFLLERIFRNMPGASVVRVLDKGMLADQHGNGMEFIVLEKAEIPVQDYLDSATSAKERRSRVCEIALQMLKGIADLHALGLLHRDLKPDNMALTKGQGNTEKEKADNEQRPITLLFDLGMSRMYTDGEGAIRPPRSVVPFRGTPEWASGHAAKGREQTRFDDLIAWLYVIVELFDRKETNQPLPWTYRTNSKAASLLKSTFLPARHLLRYCPSQFYSINAYLQTANRQKPPDYGFIADRLREAMEEVRKQPEDGPPKKSSSSGNNPQT